MTELDKLTALMSETDALAMRVVTARHDGALTDTHAREVLDQLAAVAGRFQSLLDAARQRGLYATRPRPSIVTASK